MKILKLRLKVTWSNGHTEWLSWQTVKDLDTTIEQGDGIAFYSIYKQDQPCDVNVEELTQHLDFLRTKYSDANNTQLLGYEILERELNQ